MGLLSLFKNKAAALAATQPARGESPAPSLWRKSDFNLFPAGQDQHLVSRDGGVPMAMPSFVADFLLRCDEFRGLEEHVRRHAEEHDWHALQVESLVAWLPRLRESGLLISPEDIRARCAAMVDPGNRPAPVGLIGFPTGGDRTAMLERCLRSFGANFRAHGRSPEMLVTDSSALPEQRAAFRALLVELKRELGLPLRYAGEEEKRRFAGELVRRSGCRASSVEFALFDPLGAGFLCGANRNALLLHEAGRMAVSVDDDVICEIAPRSSGARVTLFALEHSCEHHFFATREDALAAVEFADVDFLAAHESLLGRDVGVLFPPDLTAAEIDVSHVDDAILHRLGQGRARFRTTFFGNVGDPGSPTSTYFFYVKGKTLERLTASEELYRAAFHSRSVVIAVPAPSIGGGLLTPGMTIGLDHREVLPPFLPVLHAEDSIFGAATWLCCTHSVSGHLPFATHHDSGPDKKNHHPGDLNADRRATVFETATILRHILFRSAPPEHADNGERIRMLGRNLSAFAAQPARDFREALRLVVQQVESAKLCYLEERLRVEPDAPEFWRRDLDDFIAHTREAMTHEDFDIPFDLKGLRSDEENRRLIQQLLANYGALLEDWPDMVAAARELRESGYVFSTEVSAD